MTPFRHTRRIDFCETDMAGIVHFSNFFRFMESAECAFLRHLGLTVKLEWEGEMLSLPRVSAHCDYLKPARFEDVIDIDVAVKNMGTKSITYDFTISRAGEVLARGYVTSVCCRTGAEGRFESIEIPTSFRARFEPWLSGA